MNELRLDETIKYDHKMIMMMIMMSHDVELVNK